MSLLSRLRRLVVRRASPILVPYTTLRPETAKALAKHGPLFVRMNTTDDYWRLLNSAWATQETFVVVEHDVVPHEGALEELLRCEHDWCAFPYMVAGIERPALGCTKFSTNLMVRSPDLMIAIGDKERHWSVLDAFITVGLELQGERCHVHSPAVAHLNEKATEPILPADAKMLKGVLKAREMDREIARINRLKAEKASRDS